MKKLVIQNLHASVGEKHILKGISLTIKPGEVHALMGPNGSGKSTLASVLMGHPDYQTSKISANAIRKNQTSKIELNGKNISESNPEIRAQEGLFMAFQHPISIPGVSLVNFLRSAYRHLHQNKKQPSALEFFGKLKEIANTLQLNEELLKRPLNEGLSGGERKKIETLQMLVLEPKYIILDEIDTGTDVDALKIIGQTIGLLVKNSKSKIPPGILLITHYSRIFQYIKPDYVHILKEGKIVKSGYSKLVEKVEKKGYEEF